MMLKWQNFKELLPQEKLLERAAVIVAKWFQPQKDVIYSHIETSLDNIAQSVLNCLKEKHPDHSIFSISAENFSYWRNNNIDDNYWNEVEAMQIIDILEDYIFGKLNFQRKEFESNKAKMEYMCIDNVSCK